MFNLMFTASLPLLWLSVAPEDFSSAVHYNVTFRQTAFTDRDDPVNTTVSSPIFSSIMEDDFFEGIEYFQARIVETSDRFTVRIGQDTVNVTITDSESFIRLKCCVDYVQVRTFTIMKDQLGAKHNARSSTAKPLWSKDRY